MRGLPIVRRHLAQRAKCTRSPTRLTAPRMSQPSFMRRNRCSVHLTGSRTGAHVAIRVTVPVATNHRAAEFRSSKRSVGHMGASHANALRIIDTPCSAWSQGRSARLAGTVGGGISKVRVSPWFIYIRPARTPLIPRWCAQPRVALRWRFDGARRVLGL